MFAAYVSWSSLRGSWCVEVRWGDYPAGDPEYFDTMDQARDRGKELAGVVIY